MPINSFCKSIHTRDLARNINYSFMFLTLILFAISLVSCAGNSKTAELMAAEYMTMSNDDLQLYYYQLEDQIVADERVTTGSSVSIGVGRGSYGRAGGVGMSTGNATQPVATDLRNRRNEVRMELSKRGITP